jgi:hypothetical protein
VLDLIAELKPFYGALVPVTSSSLINSLRRSCSIGGDQQRGKSASNGIDAICHPAESTRKIITLQRNLCVY